MTLRLIDTFSGIGSFSYAAEKLVGGFKTVAFVECEPFCQKVLKKHWPHVEQFHDIRTYNPEPYSASVVVGGFPCQSISNNGSREGITTTSESGLWFELYRVILQLRPRYVVLENVAAILNNGIGIVLGQMAQAGFDCEYACIPASFIGAAHERDRWFCVCFRRDAANANGLNVEGGRKEGEQIQPKFCKERLFSWSYKRNMLSPKWRSYISEPVILRRTNGAASGVDRARRLKALGNSIVPQVAAIPLQRVLDLEKLTVSA